MIDEKYAVFHVDGGMGKNILATAVVEVIKKNDPERKIVVVSGWADVWLNNPHIHRIYQFGNIPYFYENYVKNKDVKVYRQEPYFSENYILKKEHMIATWCKLYNINYNNEKPNLYLNPLEIEVVRNKMIRSKPIMIIQTNGGAANQELKYSWYRDIFYPYATSVVEHYKNDYHIFHIRRPDQIAIEGTEILNLNNRELFAAFLFSQKRLLIDSFGQHACAALSLPSTVVWIGNHPDILGYNIHKNIISKKEEYYNTLHSSYLENYDITGLPIQYPYKDFDLFKIDDIIQSLK